ncbi:MAG: AraC family transcriptional regulator [Rhodospirillaceae bacterium]|nr:AraC family transcriptional regulator [Rhodospirillaceae bacterium]
MTFAALIEQYTKTDGIHLCALPRVELIRYSAPTAPMPTLYQPALCILAQGKKQVMIGEDVLVYDTHNYLAVSVDMPATGQVLEASARKPYLCIKLDLDMGQIAELMIAMGLDRAVPAQRKLPPRGMAVAALTPDLLDAVVRLLTLLATPQDIPIMAPLIEREIMYRLLMGPEGARLQHMAHAESHNQQIVRAITWIKKNYDKPFSMDKLARAAGMSRSSLHEHFKAVTAMSPLQYQKQIRLQEARRMILLGAQDAATAGHNVGYESPSQFSREYSRLFGAPPVRDAARLRADPGLAFVA